jgi:uncharacterized protein YuzE
MEKPMFRMEASFDDKTGRTVALYLRAREGEVVETKEIKEGLAYADYDANGLLLGIELLGPCELAVLDSLADKEPEPVRRFLKNSVPRGLVPAWRSNNNTGKTRSGPAGTSRIPAGILHVPVGAAAPAMLVVA